MEYMVDFYRINIKHCGKLAPEMRLIMSSSRVTVGGLEDSEKTPKCYHLEASSTNCRLRIYSQIKVKAGAKLKKLQEKTMQI